VPLSRTFHISNGGLTHRSRQRNWRDGVRFHKRRAGVVQRRRYGFHHIVRAGCRDISTAQRRAVQRGRAIPRESRDSRNESRAKPKRLRIPPPIPIDRVGGERAGSRAFARGRPIRRERLPTGIPLRDRCGFFRSTLYTVPCSRKAPLSSLNRSGLTNPRAISILWVHIPPHKYIRADNAPR